MKILTVEQTRAWDVFTIENEPIASVELMNRAAKVFTDWLVQTYPDHSRPVVVFCGTGNNGGDGVAVARLLHWIGFSAKVVVCDFGTKHSVDFDAQMALLPKHGNIVVERYHAPQAWPVIPKDALVVDALFGSGLSRPLEGVWAQVIDYLNGLPNEVVSIDMPSGLFADMQTPGNAVVRADRTFSFERPKRAFLFPENAERVGDWTFRSIGLHPEFEQSTVSLFQLLTQHEAAALHRPRSKFAHKGTFGHALLIAGSFGKMGAAVLAAKACLRSGVGLLSIHAPRSGNIILQGAVPEAMVSADHRAKYWAEVPEIHGYASIGVGPGIGKEPETAAALQTLLNAYSKPMVLDADALNLLAESPAWWENIPQNSIITPHPKEFERLFGKPPMIFNAMIYNGLKHRPMVYLLY